MPPQTSTKAVRRARRLELFQRYQRNREYLQFMSITGTTVVLRYGGYVVDFEYRDGRITRGKQTCRYLSDEDWMFLFSLASDLMKAVTAGYKKNQPSSERKLTDPAPAQDPRQQRLL